MIEKDKYTIETERLIIFPLKKNELSKYADSPDELAKELNIIFISQELEPETKNAILNDLLPHLNDDDEYFFFSTMWLIIEKKSGNQVGGFCFHGPLETNNEVEIGYGTEPKFQNNGFMTESLYGMLSWLKKNNLVKTVIAKTNNDNIPSWRVLEKNNFMKISKDNNLITWKFVLKG